MLSSYGKQLVVPQKVEHRVCYRIQAFYSWIYDSKRGKQLLKQIHIHTQTHTHVFIAALFTTAKDGNDRFISIVQQWRKGHTSCVTSIQWDAIPDTQIALQAYNETSSHVKWNIAPIPALVGMRLENIMLSEKKKNRHKSSRIAWFHLYEISRIGKSGETADWWLPGNVGRRKWKVTA